MSGLMSKFKNIFAPEDEYDDEDDYDEMGEEETVNHSSHMRSVSPVSVPKVVSLNNNQVSHRMEILNFTMISYEMTGEICAYIKNKKPMIVNMQQLNSHDMQRSLDFLTGACYALNGTVEKVTDNIFIFAPENVNISPERVKQRGTFPPTV